ncbi:hypothetical protein BZA77DRAFT_385030 [Pyronema omphalodes]|nr:hypothetical protein BZA77DRAFT_385030 [Pyronema omphalodes]
MDQNAQNAENTQNTQRLSSPTVDYAPKYPVQDDFSGLEYINHMHPSSAEYEGLQYSRVAPPSDNEGLEVQYMTDGPKHQPSSLNPSPNLILGLRRKVFWVIVMVTIFVIAVGGGVGGYLSITQRRGNNTPATSQSNTSNPELELKSLDPDSPLENTSLTVSTRGGFNSTESYLFYQSNSGELFFSPLSSTNPLHPKSLGPSFRARNHTPLSALSATFQYGIHQPARLYYIDTKGYIVDAIYSAETKTWTPGRLHIELPAPMKFSSCDWVPRKWREEILLYHHVFYQGKDGSIWQTSLYVNNSYTYPWDTPQNPPGAVLLPGPAKGSPLALGNDQFKTGDFMTQGLRLYWQGFEGDIISARWNGGGPAILDEKWSATEIILKGAKTLESLAVVPKLMANGTMEEESLFFGEEGVVNHFLWKRKDRWLRQEGYVGKRDAGPNVAAGYTTQGDMRLFWQNKTTGAIVEARRSGNGWEVVA